MEGEIKNFEKLLNLMPFGWEEKARELGALTRSREIKDARDLLSVIFRSWSKDVAHQIIL